jgi:abortive infection bacteriophage resistance protein
MTWKICYNELSHTEEQPSDRWYSCVDKNKNVETAWQQQIAHYLSQQHGNCGFDHLGPQAWDPRSTGLNKLHNFLRGYMQKVVHQQTSQTMQAADNIWDNSKTTVKPLSIIRAWNVFTQVLFAFSGPCTLPI